MTEKKPATPATARPKAVVSADQPPAKPTHAFRVTLTLTSSRSRLDGVLMEELRKQKRCLALRHLSRMEFKELFKKKKIRIKGQPAVPSSGIAQGTTYVDIMGFAEDGATTGAEPALVTAPNTSDAASDDTSES